MGLREAKLGDHERHFVSHEARDEMNIETEAVQLRDTT